jgi:hypothetical protein
MKTYILFLFAKFTNLEEIEFFCLEHFPQIPVGSIKYVIETNGNCIIIFDSDKEKADLILSLEEILSLEYIRFYMVFEKDSLFTFKLPEDLNDFIFKPVKKTNNIFNTIIKNDNAAHNLDEILEKIQKYGVDSLTLEEKTFLDDFEN